MLWARQAEKELSNFFLNRFSVNEFEQCQFLKLLEQCLRKWVQVDFPVTHKDHKLENVCHAPHVLEAVGQNQVDCKGRLGQLSYRVIDSLVKGLDFLEKRL